MNRHEIHLLQQIKGYPAITVTLPTHRTAPDNRQDPIRVRNLVDRATERLLGEFKRRQIQPLLDHLEHLANGLDYQHLLDGLALFVNGDFGRAVQVPFSLRERVVVDESFFTRDLVLAWNRTPRYWALALSEKPTRLFAGTRDTLAEVHSGGFPMAHVGPSGEQPPPSGYGIEKSTFRDELRRQFLRQVDAGLRPLLAEDPLPLVVVGVDRLLAFFMEVTDHRESIVATLTGSHDKTPAHDLGHLVWPLVSAHLAEQCQSVLVELDAAVGEGKSASTVGEAWRLAKDGRGRLLLVEENFHCPARADATGMILTPADDPTAPDVVDDAVDEIIETVLRKHGQVVFVNDGELAAHQRIALILRY